MKKIFWGLLLFLFVNVANAQKNELTNCKVDPTTKNEICFGSYKDASGSYEGEYVFKENQLKQPTNVAAMTGKGIFIWPNGDKYQGEFSNGKVTGKGIMFFANKNKYQGEFLNGEIHGKGEFFYENGNFKGDRYEGEFSNGKVTGKGKILKANGSYFEGDFLDSKMLNGKGTIFFSDGSKYAGQISLEKMNGKGTLVFTNGDKYTGEFKEGRFDGNGTYNYANGKAVEGEFKAGQPYLTKVVLTEYEKKEKLRLLESEFGIKCKKNKNNNNEYQKCLNEQEQIAKKNKEQEEFKLAEENKKKQLIADKQKIEREKTEAKIANMKPEERRAYICENTYGFGKGSNKFSDCVYKIMNAEVDLQKLELQKKLAEAQQETARANESAARANASRSSTPTYDPNVAAAMERTNEIERARILLNLGQALRTPVIPQRSAPVPQTNCRVARGGYINCW
jgi:hypothetical protein